MECKEQSTQNCIHVPRFDSRILRGRQLSVFSLNLNLLSPFPLLYFPN